MEGLHTATSTASWLPTLEAVKLQQLPFRLDKQIVKV